MVGKRVVVLCVLVLAAFLVAGYALLSGSGAPKLKVLAIGFDHFSPMMASDLFKAAGVEYGGAANPLAVQPETLAGFDVVILDGANSCDAGNTKLCSCTDSKRTEFTSMISNYVNSGGKVVFVGTPTCNSTAGFRRDEFDGIIPVQYSGPNRTITYYDNSRIQSSNPEQLPYYVPGLLRPTNLAHPVFSGVTNLSLTLEGRPFAVLAPGAVALADFVSYSGSHLLVMAESGPQLKGKAFYFGFNPANMASGDGNSVLLNTLLYLRDAKS